MNILSPAQSLKKIYRKITPSNQELEKFKSELVSMYNNIMDNQTEETQKNFFQKFLETIFNDKYCMIPENGMDLVVHLQKEPTSKIGIIFEFKRTTSGDMISLKDLDKKALQELLYYYLKERVINNNTDLKHLVISNIKELYIFDATEFESKFYGNKELIKDFTDFYNKSKSIDRTDQFYKEIASKAIKQIQDKIEFTHVDLWECARLLASNKKCKNIKDIYKVLSDKHLLKLQISTDSNSLNKNFYSELLHIIGLEEVKIDSKIVIQRLPYNKRNEASLIENTINKIKAECYSEFINIEGAEQKTAKIYETALELCITWINRLLFLKLLEAQLIKHNNGDDKFKILSIDRIENFNKLNSLFFEVLALNYQRRESQIARKFNYVPYLNSSLFEVSELEKRFIKISSLDQDSELPIYSKSILYKCGYNNKSLSTLHYIFAFLGAYNFANDNVQGNNTDSGTLINASVLGLIFEKINGHKDGAIFTPGNITMYMCREAITSAVVKKFNDKYKWNLKSYSELINKNINIEEGNRLINSLRICDPAVGSGHFLVSALNEIIRIKFELGILADKEGMVVKKQDYNISVENDELVVTCADGQYFNYRKKIKESQRIQKTLFNEKQTIIENCLFGVDINSNSVNICRLRLWIELLKNAYYTEESNLEKMETLPNIDINIRCGDALVSRYKIDDKLKEIKQDTKVDLKEYFNAIFQYKTTHNDKITNRNIINDVKYKLRNSIIILENKSKELSSLKSQLAEIDDNSELSLKIDYTVDKKSEQQRKKKIKELKKKISEKEKEINQFKANKYRIENGFEWRIDFPEVLDENYDFEGFDIVIGNPPYIQLQKATGRKAVDKKGNEYDEKLGDLYVDCGFETFKKTGDIYCLFYEKGMSLLKPQGILCYITSNKWMRAGYGESTRDFFAKKTNPIKIIDFSGVKIFDNATVDVNILILKKEANAKSTLACKMDSADSVKKLSDFVQQQAKKCSFETSDSWVILSPIEQSIKHKIESVGTPLKDWDIQINYGIKTGFNDAFIISTETRDQILNNCQTEDERKRTAELIRPILRGSDIKRYGYEWAKLYLIATFPSRHYDIDDYPAVKSYLLSFGVEHLEQTGIERVIKGVKVKARKKTNNKWFEVQDSISYWEDFSKPKIVWGNLNLSASYALVENNYFINAPSPMLVPANKYLLAMLNSKLIDFYIRQLGVTRNGGYFEYKPMFVSKAPIPLLKEDDEKREQIEQFVESKDYIAINRIIYEIFGLTEQEINYINSL
jgi:type II restriction/modification system DNA methylase subunit YeeA